MTHEQGDFLPTIRSWAVPLLLLTALALMIRLPYWDVIPAANDEINQTIYAYHIARGEMRPLVANDAYAGPFYIYLLAAFLSFTNPDPMAGRMLAVVVGTLTVPVAYGWTTALTRRKAAGLIAALLVATNPDLIVINSHLGGTTYLLPLLSTLFLWLLLEAYNRDHVGWLIAAGVVAGLVVQANLVGAGVVAGGLLWFLWQSRRRPNSGKWWPFWPVAAGLLVILVYSPVIVHNLVDNLDSVNRLQGQSYLWQDNPTLFTTVNNLRRFSFQTVRQVSGVLTGDETITTILGIPLLYLGCMIVGLIYTTRQVSVLPLFVLLPFWIGFPIFSSHYGFLHVGRFTTLLIPVWSATIATLLAAIIERGKQLTLTRQRWLTTAALLFALFLAFYPLLALNRYYQSVLATHSSGQMLLGFSRYITADHQGEPVYLSTIEELSFLNDFPYVPHAAFLFADIYHEFLPPQQIVGRLFQKSGPAYLILSDRDAEIIQQTARLERIAIPANEEAHWQQFGLYRLDTTIPLVRPDFVLNERNVPGPLAPTATLAGTIRLFGCELPASATRGQILSFQCYWQAQAELPANIYIGFAHLINPETTTLLTQDDHVLGQERYPLNAWNGDEVIRESYSLNIPTDAPAGQYQLWLGIYTWPDLQRLDVPGTADDVVELNPITINP